MTHRGGGMKSNQTSGNEKNLSNIISSNSDRPYQYSNKNTNQRYSSYKYSKTGKPLSMTMTMMII